MREIEEFEAIAEIRIHRGAMPGDDRRAFDARRVLADIGPRIERPRG